MREEIKSFIDAVEAGHAVEAEAVFNNIVLQKAGEALETMRVDVAQNMFKSQNNDE